MANRIPHLDRAGAILDILRERAARRERIGYGELAKRIKIFPRGPWRPLIKHIAQAEIDAGRPDITMLIYGADTGYPHMIDFEDAKEPTESQKARADQIVTAVFAYYAKQPVSDPNK